MLCIREVVSYTSIIYMISVYDTPHYNQPSLVGEQEVARRARPARLALEEGEAGGGVRLEVQVRDAAARGGEEVEGAVVEAAGDGEAEGGLVEPHHELAVGVVRDGGVAEAREVAPEAVGDVGAVAGLDLEHVRERGGGGGVGAGVEEEVAGAAGAAWRKQEEEEVQEEEGEGEGESRGGGHGRARMRACMGGLAGLPL